MGPPCYSKSVTHIHLFWTISLSAVLFAAILLGDARQSVVDVFMAGTVIAGFFALWKTASFRRMPKEAVMLWGAVIVMATPFFWPNNIGGAIQGYIRYLLGFMVFGLLYSVATRSASWLLERVLLVVGVAVSIFTVLFLFIPHPPWLPLMNLLYPSYGHNHAADILLFVLPLVLYTKELNGRVRTALWVVVLCGLVFSFARGAWVLAALFGVWAFLFSGIRRQRKILLSGVVFVLALVFVGASATNNWTRNVRGKLVDSPAIHRVINKGSPLSDPRLEYWTQALKMIRERPLFGSGPGSFYYGSRRLQSQPSLYSWFAHSFVLQTLAEQGIIGALPVLVLFGLVLWRAVCVILRHPPEHSPLGRLSVGLLLVAAYSFIEFNLSFAVVWALFWAVAGLIFGAEKIYEEHKTNNGRQLLAALLLLLVFYVLFIGQSAALVMFPKRADIAFYLTPFDAVTARYYLTSGVVTPRGITMVESLHGADPETLQVVADAWRKSGFMGKSLYTRGQILIADPLNEDNHKEYLSQLVESARYDEAAVWFSRYPSLFFHAAVGGRAVNVPALYIKDYPQEYQKLFESKYSHEVRYSRFYYNLGLWYLSTEPEKTRDLLELASLLQPKLSFLWLERFFLEKQVFTDEIAAKKIIEECLNNPSAAKHCGGVSIENQVYLPGHYKTEINEK